MHHQWEGNFKSIVGDEEKTDSEKKFENWLNEQLNVCMRAMEQHKSRFARDF